MTTPSDRLAAPPEAVDDNPVVARLMTRHIVAIVPEATLPIALRLMSTSGVRHLPVFEGARCTGLLVETDALRGLTLVAESGDYDPVLTVRHLCRTAPAVRPHDRRSTAAQRMHDAGIDAALVTDGGQLLGIVTATDLIRSLAHASIQPPGHER
jgi:CBS domain-containing protein